MTGNMCTINEFVQHAYDYIICGGGTAGLVLAARLSELPNVTVGVIEAGGNSLEDPNILTPLLFPTLLTNPRYDWMYTTSPQVRDPKPHPTKSFHSLLNSMAVETRYTQYHEERRLEARAHSISWYTYEVCMDITFAYRHALDKY